MQKSTSWVVGFHLFNMSENFQVFQVLFNTLRLSYNNNIRSNIVTIILQFYGSSND